MPILSEDWCVAQLEHERKEMKKEIFETLIVTCLAGAAFTLTLLLLDKFLPPYDEE
jgi:hypothetical protein